MRITNARILTGDAVIERGELTLDGGRVTSVRSLDGEAHPASSGTPYARRADDGTRPPSSGTTSGRHDDDEAHPASSGPGGEVVDLGGALVAPGFVDLMVNGGGGVLFNAQPARLSEIVAAHRVLGTTSILPNLITDTAERMEAARAAVDAEAGSAVLGIHFEGPLLSRRRPGMHALAHLTDVFPVELARRTERVATVVTLAPEVAGTDAIRELVDVGARVALGHSDATLTEFRGGVDAGASLVTHLFNGMRPFAGRDPGIMGGGLVEDRVWVDLINDGVHADFAAVRLAWQAKPAGKCFYVTDAMPPVGSDETEFVAVGTRVRLVGGRLLTDGDTLGGSVLTMAEAVRNGVEHVGIPVEESLRMASTYPARFLGVDDRVGRLVPGCHANLVVLDEALAVTRVMFEGEWQGPEGVQGPAQ